MANTQTTATSLPSWVEGPTKTALGDISSWLKSPDNYVYGSKPGESLYTPLTQSQNESIGNANWWADQDLRKMLGLDKAEGLWNKFTGAGAQTMTGTYKNQAASKLGTERLVDENGFLGKIDDYINPYIKRVLDPQLREIEELKQRAYRDQGAQQTMAGAFGDARHGIMDSEIFAKSNEAISDTTGKAYSDAFNTAMGMRSGDIGREDTMDLAKAGYAEGDVNRLFQRDTINQQAREANVNRQAVGAKGITDIGQLFAKNFSDANDQLFNAGEVQRDAQEEQRLSMEKFQTAIKDKKFNDALKILASMQGTQQPTTTTSEQSSNDGLGGIIAAFLGSMI